MPTISPSRVSVLRLAPLAQTNPQVTMSENGMHKTDTSVVENPRLEALRSDELFWAYVEHGSIDAAVTRLMTKRHLTTWSAPSKAASMSSVTVNEPPDSVAPSAAHAIGSGSRS